MSILRIPVSTYRIQFNKDFGFRDALDLIPYLHSLGVTDLYASPLLQARHGSPHGYDVTCPSHLNPELGSEEEFELLARDLRSHGMGLLLDIVPNHMAASSENPWWRDVLENGPGSTYATYFDVDWHPPNRTLDNKVLLPVLGRRYSEALENQELTLIYEETGFFIQYADTKLPVAPKSYLRILEHRLEDLDRKAGADSEVVREFRGIFSVISDLPERVALPSEAAGERRMQREAVKERLWKLYNASAEIRELIDRNLDTFNGRKKDPRSFGLLDQLLSEQAYVLSFWRAANEEINYRRFFAITDLVGVRVEDPLVFDATHTEILRLVGKGSVTGLRVDHIDGLHDPAGYLRRLQERLADSTSAISAPGFYVVVEKILSAGEALPADWPVLGTTGYDFLNILNGIFVDPRGFPALDDVYTRYLGAAVNFADLVYDKKKEVMDTLLAVEMRALGHHLSLLAEQDRYARDLPATGLTRALVETVACMTIYRTYTRTLAVAPADRQSVSQALQDARRRNPALNPACFDFLRDVLLLRESVQISPEQREARLGFVMRWQQFTGPIMAKGFEDTVLYLYNRLASLDEVGGRPHSEGVSLPDFHDSCRQRLRHWPCALNATSTHDTKRSEDVRARIDVLSEIPEEWAQRLARWSRWNEPKKKRLREHDMPDRNEEILIYQTMLGAWPLEPAAAGEFRKRLQDYMIKATREAKVHTKWTRPNSTHENALARFIAAITRTSSENRFLKDFLEFQRQIAYYGAFNALAQVMVKMTAPGVPDFYQGSELWDLHLVDPDNRSPVDYRKRKQRLEELQGRGESDLAGVLRELIDHWDDGRIKLYTIFKTLNFRKAHPEIFAEGDYLPVKTAGGKSAHVIAFARRSKKEWAIVAAPRFVTKLVKGPRPPLGAEVWERSALALPKGSPRNWIHVLTREEITPSAANGRGLLCADVFKSFPVALLYSP
ncbi:MAG TPA: malto-oligosyltrehalose synthase [Terriglobia bacterium]|nr:malto-oligosyltrehalose synthase [Terriglobia bacterium]